MWDKIMVCVIHKRNRIVVYVINVCGRITVYVCASGLRCTSQYVMNVCDECTVQYLTGLRDGSLEENGQSKPGLDKFSYVHPEGDGTDVQAGGRDQSHPTGESCRRALYSGSTLAFTALLTLTVAHVNAQ